MNVAGGQSTEEYFQAVAFNSLVNIVLDPALSPLHYTKAMDAIVLIFLTQGLKCVTFLPQVCCSPCSFPLASLAAFH